MGIDSCEWQAGELKICECPTWPRFLALVSFIKPSKRPFVSYQYHSLRNTCVCFRTYGSLLNLFPFNLRQLAGLGLHCTGI